MDTTTVLQAASLSCTRQNRLIFENLNFEITAGELLLIEGPNGSGKSSLLRLLAGLSTPANGTIYWHGQSIGPTYWDHLHFIGHTNGIKLGLTVQENLTLASHLIPTVVMPAKAGIQNILSLLQLDSYQNTPARFLSAGQKRRIALAKLFLHPKPLWILDEPLTALDTTTQTLLLTHLKQHLNQNGIAIISSHHPIAIPIKKQTLRLPSC